MVRHKCLSLHKVSFGPNDRGSSKVFACHCHFFSNSRFLFCGKNLTTNQSWKQRLLVISFDFRHICHTLLELTHKMSQIDDCDCAMFACQQCSPNIKVSAQVSSWKFKKGLSRNQVEAPAINVDEPLGKIFQALDWRNFDWIKQLERRFAQLMSVWKHYKLMAIEKLQIMPNFENRDVQH